jgi:tRNA G46 methylase TrmB
MKKIKAILLTVLDSLFNLLNKENRFYIYTKYKHFTHNNDHLLSTNTYIKNLNINPKVIIDIGSANGSSTLIFANYFPNAKVIAFEPIPYFFNIAKDKCSKNINIDLRNIALSDFEGHQEFFVTKNYV